MTKSKLALLGAGIIMPMVSMAATPLWMRDVKISPDGTTIVFTYKGDLWTVPATGGNATRLTARDSYEANPVWSPDSKSIAFTSDRHGNADVFIINAKGGAAKRLTYDSANETPEAFSADGKDVLFSASIQDPASSALFPTGRMTELYAVPVKGGAARQLLATPAQMISWNADGKSFLYQDIKGFEDEWRKHHTSSVTRDIWMYDTTSGKHTNLTNRGGEDRNPVSAGDDFYFLSERNGGSMNVYKAPLANASVPQAVTAFRKHPVRFLSRAENGVLCYTYDGEIYTQTPDGKPAKVAIDVIDVEEALPVKMSVRSGARDVTPSPDGKEVAFVYRGDVFVTSTEYNTTKQITKTPEAEADLCWSKDGKALYYDSQREGVRNIWKAEKGHADDPDFANATTIKETRMFPKDGVDRMEPVISPDGKTMAYIQDRNRIMLMDLKSKSTRQLTDGSTNPSRRGGFYFTWSPDSKWIATDVIDKKHDPYSDIAIINVADGKITNLTNSGYFAENPKWVLDGNAIMYATDRYGMRSHASWGSQTDLMLVFLNRDAYDKYRLSEEDYAIRKDLEKKAKDKDKDDKKEKGDKDKKKDAKDEKAEDKSINVELDGIADRVVRLTPMSSDLSDAMMSADGETVYYLTSIGDGTQLWKIQPRKDEHRMVTKASGSRGFVSSGDGKTWFMTGMNIKKFDPKSEKMTPVNYSSNMTVDPAAEREFMFDYVTREEGERFYSKGMHGVDWPALTSHYRKFLPHINNNYDFAELLSELLGELNASHTGGRYSHPSAMSDDRTATLGLLYDMTYTGDGYKVDEIVVGSPFDRASSKLAKGEIIEKINGEELKAGQDHTALFTDIAGKKTLVGIYNPADGSHREEVVLPISKGRFNSLLYDRWVKQRAADVDKWSNGRLGYVHIQSMGDDSFRDIYSDILGKYNDREGIVIDVRWNGGGRLHEDIEVMFTGKKYLTQEIRGVDVCDMPSRRWNKPSIMVMSEACYSNAHGTPWVYKHMNIGKLVGMPVPGTMTSVNWVTMQDPTMVFGIPAIGYRTAEGTYLENSQLEPDIKIANSPENVVKGEDAQLRKAVETILHDLDAAKAKK